MKITLYVILLKALNWIESAPSEVSDSAKSDQLWKMALPKKPLIFAGEVNVIKLMLSAASASHKS